MFQKILLMSASLMLVACAQRRDTVCSGNVLSQCEPSIYFAFNSVDTNQTGMRNLDWVAEKLNKYPDRIVYVSGYSDLFGDKQYNEALALKRANKVKSELEKRGVSADRINVKVMGQAEPVSLDPKRQNLNRRVDVTFGHRPHEYHLTCN